MKRFKKILLVWGEETPTSALFPWCRRLAIASEADGIDGLWCVDRSLPDYPGLELGELGGGPREGGRELLEELVGLPVKVETHEGDPLKAVLERLATGTYDLVLVSIHDPASRNLAERLARKSPVGVLALPPSAGPPPRKIMVGIDFSDMSSLCLSWGEAFATVNDEGGASLIGVHVMAPPKLGKETMVLDQEALRSHVKGVAKQHLSDFIGEHAREAGKWEQVMLENEAASEALMREGDERGSDFLVIGCHGRNALSIALLGSHACEVMRHGETAVLVAKRKNENLGFLRELLGQST